MKRLVLAVSLLALLALAVSCASGGDGGSAGLALGAAPWQDGDKLTYDWLDKSDNKSGTAEVSLAKDGGAWVISWADKIGAIDQESKVRIDAQTLKPLGAEKTIKAQGTDAKIDTTYQDGKLDIKAVVNGEDKSASIDVPANAIDNDQLLMTLRALQFADGYEGKCVIVVGQSAAKVDTTVRVKGKESVTVPAGSYEAWKVELDFGQAKQYAWYQTDAAHNLVQYDNGATKAVLTK